MEALDALRRFAGFNVEIEEDTEQAERVYVASLRLAGLRFAIGRSVSLSFATKAVDTEAEALLVEQALDLVYALRDESERIIRQIDEDNP